MRQNDSLLEQVWLTIKNYQMIEEGMHVVVGVSGGADSVCLLRVLAEYRKTFPFQITAVHIEHGIRGQESLEDAGYVEELCRKWQIPFCVYHVDAAAYAKEHGLGVEEAGRMLRYEKFERVCREQDAQRIAVAHNRNDQAETVLMNLARGSGIRGLGGIQPVRGRIIRPLLLVSRDEIERWLNEQQISWRTDRTNLTIDYTRNRVRHQLLPLLTEQINAGAVRHIAETAMRLQEAEEYFRAQANRICSSAFVCKEDHAELRLKALAEEEKLLQEYILRHCIEQIHAGQGLRDYGSVHIEKLRELINMQEGKRIDLPGNVQVIKGRDVLLFYSGKEETAPEARAAANNVDHGCEELPLHRDGIYEFGSLRFQVSFSVKEDFPDIFPQKKYTKWLAYDKIKDDVCIRRRCPGDYLIVNQQGGRKKLKDYLIDCKIPREQRDELVVVAQGSHILWVVGWRISENAKVSETTQQLVKIQICEDTI